MRKKIFEKASYLLKTKQVKQMWESEYHTIFQVGKYQVIARYQNHRLIWLCDCMADTMNYLCAHKLAAQTWLINSLKNKKEY